MAQPPERSIREVLLDTVYKQHEGRHRGSLQQMTVLNAVSEVLCPYSGDQELEEAILTQWNDLFRSGLLAWGMNLNNPNPPFLHLTDRGRKALENATRDPSNPAGYMRHLEQGSLGLHPVAKSYVNEALECYVMGLFKAAAVMVGAAAETIILELRDMVVEKLTEAGARVPSELNSWKIKNVTDALSRLFERIDAKSHRPLREKLDAYWGALTHEIRTTRNDAGHPTSINPVTPESVHASLLLFPILVSLTDDLLRWSADEL
jgi:hypothetical protein